MICLLFIPATIQTVHAFEPHQEMICSSDVEHHFHQDELECTLCHLQAEIFAILPQEDFYLASKQIQLQNNRNYRFLFNHQQLSFSLRGPPIF